MASPKNFFTSLNILGVSQSNTSFTFSSFIFIPSGPITTLKNLTSLTFYLHFSGLMYRSFSASLFTTSSTTSLCFFSSSVPTIMLFMKLATSLVLIKSLRILFIVVWIIAGEFVSLKNITVGFNNPSEVENAAFYWYPSLICILSYPPHCRSSLVNIFFVPMFSIISKIKGRR